jgi:hypothetical protein
VAFAVDKMNNDALSRFPLIVLIELPESPYSPNGYALSSPIPCVVVATELSGGSGPVSTPQFEDRHCSGAYLMMDDFELRRTGLLPTTFEWNPRLGRTKVPMEPHKPPTYNKSRSFHPEGPSDLESEDGWGVEKGLGQKHDGYEEASYSTRILCSMVFLLTTRI